MLFCLWVDAYKRVTFVVVAMGFRSDYLSGPLPYVGRHISVNKMCRVRR